MTCSSCTGSITHALDSGDITGVFDVSLLEKSTTALINREELADVALESVENCGFEAQVMSVEPVASEGVQRSSNTSRIISSRISLMIGTSHWHASTRVQSY